MAKIGWNPILYTSYLYEIHDPKKLKKTLAWVVRTLKKIQAKTPFDSIVVTGTSGVSLGYAAAAELGCYVTNIRKADRSHGSSCKIEGLTNPRTYVFLDDFLCGGATYRRVCRIIKDVNGKKILPIAIVLWKHVGCVNLDEDIPVYLRWPKTGPGWPYYMLDPKNRR